MEYTILFLIVMVFIILFVCTQETENFLHPYYYYPYNYYYPYRHRYRGMYPWRRYMW